MRYGIVCNRVKEKLVIILIVGLLIFIAYAGYSLFVLPLKAFPKTCPKIDREFEYEGCSVTYQELEDDEALRRGECHPCGGMMPCILGFKQNKKIYILKCLCGAGKEEEASRFARDYMVEDYSIQEEARPLTSAEKEDICGNIPDLI